MVILCSFFWVSINLLAAVQVYYATTPAHNKPLYHGEQRVQQVIAHHEHSLAELLESLTQWHTVSSLSTVLGWKNKRGFARCLALEETFAHATFLVNRGQAVCDDSDLSGVLRYHLA